MTLPPSTQPNIPNHSAYSSPVTYDLPATMHVFKVALMMMAISVDRLATAYDCGKDAPQNVCEVSHGDLAIYVRADKIPVRLDKNLSFPAGGKNCVEYGPHTRRCCPLATIPVSNKPFHDQ
ncbi:hypothetical protein PGTUg99_026294 [Puccinia graminis f. sp. tritici]|uniref:Uncharacterized protein n=1 Tax=Puccinia graminis f. sp. tritici TaxID=56615 RepID=A0A5B0MZY2_PUCGR|nr:hypothetical protein PGTUg99_026294 [Puccinia graminis f. sp. tritici]